jgi:hypothetical protein
LEFSLVFAETVVGINEHFQNGGKRINETVKTAASARGPRDVAAQIRVHTLDRVGFAFAWRDVVDTLIAQFAVQRIAVRKIFFGGWRAVDQALHLRNTPRPRDCEPHDLAGRPCYRKAYVHVFARIGYFFFLTK